MARTIKAHSNTARAGESTTQRLLRINGSNNGATLRTRVVQDKTKYNRKLKHNKSFAEAGNFSFTDISTYIHSTVIFASILLSLR